MISEAEDISNPVDLSGAVLDPPDPLIIDLKDLSSASVTLLHVISSAEKSFILFL